MGIEEFKQKRMSHSNDFNTISRIYKEYNRIVQEEMKKLFEFSEYDIETWLNKILDREGNSDYLTLQILPWKVYKSLSPCEISIEGYAADSISKVLSDIKNPLYSYSAEKNYLIFHQQVEEEQLDKLQPFFISYQGRFIPRIDVNVLRQNMIGNWLDSASDALERFGLKVT